MKANNDLYVYTNRGRPKETSHKISASDTLKKELRKLKKELSFTEGTEILLALSMASDEMIRHVQMFPEVWFMDVTAQTNKQNRDIFIMVVKDASRQCYAGNITVIPSGQLWVFMRIYSMFFLELYGMVTVRRNRLALTDDDRSEHVPFDNLIETSEHYQKSKHMLCTFHALVKQFHEDVYPHMPHKANSKELTKKGRLYCESTML
jgi:hypothetical protein